MSVLLSRARGCAGLGHAPRHSDTLSPSGVSASPADFYGVSGAGRHDPSVSARVHRGKDRLCSSISALWKPVPSRALFSTVQLGSISTLQSHVLRTSGYVPSVVDFCEAKTCSGLDVYIVVTALPRIFLPFLVLVRLSLSPHEKVQSHTTLHKLVDIVVDTTLPSWGSARCKSPFHQL